MTSEKLGAYLCVGSEVCFWHVEHKVGPGHDGEAHVHEPVKTVFARGRQTRNVVIAAHFDRAGGWYVADFVAVSGSGRTGFGKDCGMCCNPWR